MEGWGRVIAGWVVVIVVTASVSGEARTVEEILRDKGVLSEQEAEEAAGTGSGGKAGWLSRITPSGDLRLRWETFVLGDGRRDRHRSRFRARIGAKMAVTDEIEAGLRVASGDPDDPISTNQSFSDVFSTKSIGIDNAYLKLAPARSIGLTAPILTVLGGKFDLPVFRPGEAVFDSDLRPEGFHEIVNLYQGPAGSFALQAGQWSAVEVSSGRDSWVFSGQAIGELPLPGPYGLTLAVADYGFTQVDGVARERNDNDALSITNTVRLSDGTVVGGRPVDPSREGPNGDGLDANGDPIRIVGFAEPFNVLDVSAELSLPLGPWPVSVIGDWAQNLETSRDDTAIFVGFEIGKATRPGEMSFGYLWGRKETNSVLSVLTFSDFGPNGGTNVEGHQIQIGAGLIEALTGMITFYVTEPVDDVPGGFPDTAYRMQFDVMTKF